MFVYIKYGKIKMSGGNIMDAKKRERYENISKELTVLVGGKENIQGVAHCATRLRIVLKITTAQIWRKYAM